MGECYHQGEEETEAYNGFENGEIRYETNGGYQEDDGYAEKYDRSSFDGNADLEECQFQGKEEKVMMMMMI